MQGNLDSYSHIELTSRQLWKPHKIEFPQTKHIVQVEVEGKFFLKVKIWLSGETPEDTDCPRYGDTKGDFRSHREEVVFHAGMDNFHNIL